LTHEQHGLEHLDQGHTLAAKRIWDVLSDAGLTSWVCGSMNVRYDDRIKGAVLPDPWCTKVPPTPSELGVYFRFIQQNVLEYSNDRMPLSTADYARFLAFMATHGMSVATMTSIIKQLGTENNGHNKWRRAVLLDRLQFDVFRAYFHKMTPSFSTFFLNSTAHYQHSYWRSMEPDVFHVKPTAEDQEEYESAILFGYQNMDRLLGQFLELAGSDVTLVFCTALSQQPCLKYEEQGGAMFYRPRDFGVLASFAGLPDRFKAGPVMTHQYNVEFETDADAAAAADRLRAVNVGGVAALSVEHSGRRVFTGCRIYQPVEASAMLALNDGGASCKFFDVFYKLDAMKSGMHHPDGMLWIRTPQRLHMNPDGRVPLAAVAPTILQMLGMRVPDSMRREPLHVN